jgi:hypothetical protein
MEHVWTVFCRRTLIDADTNQISIIDSIDDMSIVIQAGAKRLDIECVIASLWGRSDMRQPEKGRFRMRLRTPSGKLAVDPKMYPLDLEDARWLRTRIQLYGLPIDGPGRYLFLTELEVEDGDWKTVAQTPYEVEIMPEEGEEETPPEPPPTAVKRERKKARK